MRTVELEVGSQEWLDYRRTRIGASDIGAILGISPFSTPYELWEQKVHGKIVQLNSAMKRGLEREDEARNVAENKLGTFLSPKIVESSENEWAFSTLDGIDITGTIVVEIKWANNVVHKMAKEGVVIDYYYCQCQWQMYCTQAKEIIFLSCYEEKGSNPEYITVKLEADHKYIENMIKKGKEFYEKMLSKTPPELCDKDFKLLNNEEEAHFDWACCECEIIRNEIDLLEDKLKKMKEEALKNIDHARVRTKMFKATKFNVKGTVDYSSIPELKSVNVEDYRKPGREQWKITKVL